MENKEIIIYFEIRNILSPLFTLSNKDSLNALLINLGFNELGENDIDTAANDIGDALTELDDHVYSLILEGGEFQRNEALTNIQTILNAIKTLSDKIEEFLNDSEILHSIYQWLLTVNLNKNRYDFILKLGLLTKIITPDSDTPPLYNINYDLIKDFRKLIIEIYSNLLGSGSFQSMASFIENLSLFLKRRLNPVIDSITEGLSIKINQDNISFTFENVLEINETIEFDNGDLGFLNIDSFIEKLVISPDDDNEIEIKLYLKTPENGESSVLDPVSFNFAGHDITLPYRKEIGNSWNYVSVNIYWEDGRIIFSLNGWVDIFKNGDKVLDAEMAFKYEIDTIRTGFPPHSKPPEAAFALSNINLNQPQTFDFLSNFPLEIINIDEIELYYKHNIESPYNFNLEVKLDQFCIVLPNELVKKASYDNGNLLVSDESPKIYFRSNNDSLTLQLDSIEGLTLKGIEDVSISCDPIFIGNPENVQSGIVVRDIIVSEILLNSIIIDGATIVLPEDLPNIAPDKLTIQNFIINNDGISVEITGHWPVNKESLDSNIETKLFGGLPACIESISMSIKDNILIGGHFSGYLLIPFFDKFVEVNIAINLDWEIIITLKSTDDKGIILTKEELLSMTLKSLSVGTRNENAILALDGGFEPLLWSLDWPRFDVKGFSIEQDLTFSEPPKIKFEEAWVDLKEIATLDLYGFHFELNKIGLGYVEDTDKLWIDLTGNIKLLEALPIGVGVEGFRITWPRRIFEELGITEPSKMTSQDVLEIASSIEVKFDGVYLMYGVPGAAEFEAYIKFIKEAQKVGFSGDAELRVPATGLALEAGILVGMNFEPPPYPFLMLSFGIVLPAGIPLGQSGLALKGAQGLLGMNVKPDLSPDQNPYYDWYKKDPEGAHKAAKWTDERGSFAFGAGITITTTDGVLLGVKGLLILVIPGPIIMIEGKALVFDGVFPGDGPLKALAYLDGKEHTIQVNIEAAMELMEGIVDINAGIEAFFDFKDLTNWHLYIGKDQPVERRVYANILNIPTIGWLFQGQYYLMFEGEGTVKTGVYIALPTLDFSLEVAELKFKAILDGSGMLSVNPFQFAGDIGLEAILNVTAFGFNLIGIEATAMVDVNGALPLVVDANVKVSVDLPVPDAEDVPLVGDLVQMFEEEVAKLPDIPDYIEIDVPFHWEYNGVPKIPNIVKEIGVESYYVLGGGDIELYYSPLNSGFNEENENTIINSRTVPLDAQPTIVFDQEMNQEDGLEFAGFINDVVNYFKVGKSKNFPNGIVQLKPQITDIIIYKIPKDSFDLENIDWGAPIATASNTNHEKIRGIWRAENMLSDTGDSSKRILRLNSNNPFDFVNGMLEIPTQTDPNDPGQPNRNSSPYTSSFVENSNNDFFNNKKTPTICLDREILQYRYNKNDQKRPKYPEVVRMDDTYMYQYNFHEVNFNAVGYDLEILNRPKFHLHCLAPVNKDILRLIFEEKIYYAKICFLNEEWKNRLKIKGIIYTINKRPVEVLDEPPVKNTTDNDTIDSTKTKTGSQSERNNTSHDYEYYKDTKSIRLNYQKRGNCLTVENSSGFNELVLSGLLEVGIVSICYRTKREEEDFENRDQQNNVNEEFIQNHNLTDVLLSSNAYYKIEINHNIALKEVPEDPLIWALINSHINDNVVGDYKTKGYFQTDGPPQNLTPYIKWSSIDERKSHFFYGDDIVFRFKRAYLEKLFPDLDNTINFNFDFPFEIEAVVKTSDGKIMDGFFHNWTKASSGTLLPGEKAWKNYLERESDSQGLFEYKDDILELRKYLLLFYADNLQSENLRFKIENLNPLNTERGRWINSGGTIKPRNKVHKKGNKIDGGSIITLGNKEWDDYIFECTISDINDDGVTGIIFHYLDKNNYYSFEFSNSNSKITQALTRNSNGVKTVLVSKILENSIPEITLPTLHLKTEVSSSWLDSVSIKIHINNQLIIDYIDDESPVLTGKIGFLSINNDTSAVSNVYVYALAKNLLPSSRHELLLTGGEGGKLIFRDTKPFSEEKWLPENNGRKLCNKTVDDCEFISILNFENSSQVIFLFRYPDENRTKSNISYYTLKIKRSFNENNLYSINLSNCLVEESETYEIVKTTIENLFNRLKLRVRFVGNKISVWIFEKLIISVELSDYTKINNVSSNNLSFSKSLPNIAKYNRTPLLEKNTAKLLPKSDKIKKVNYQTAFDGLIGYISETGNNIIEHFELREVFLFKTNFTTSKYSSIASLVEGYNKTIQHFKISDVNNLFDNVTEVLNKYYKSRFEVLITSVKYENKIIDREKLEISKQKLVVAENHLDNKFYEVLSYIGDGSLGYTTKPDNLTISFINYESKNIGLYLHSPEPLNIMALFDPSIDGFETHGRMEISLVDSADNFINCLLFHNSDSTKVLLLAKNDNDEIVFLSKGKYALNFTYTRNYKDDQDDKIDHLYDRPYELNFSSSNNYFGSIIIDIV